MLAPIDVLQAVLFVDAEDVSDLAVVEEEELRFFEEADLRGGERSQTEDSSGGGEK